ncbi:MAG TPA: hypothetical protein VKA94_03245 [Hyphomicrobiales bacterium]|nr:hypothetical protein [Hyphomicrobiales bacterium]
MIRCKHIIDDPERPFPLKPGVRYRVVEDGEGRLVVREANTKKPRLSRPGFFDKAEMRS